MEFSVEVHLRIDGTGMLSGGTFKARSRRQIAEAAYEYIRRIKYETGYRHTVIEKVIVNGETDITEEVKNIENLPIPGLDDVFW